jgi:hypothetical protein
LVYDKTRNTGRHNKGSTKFIRDLAPEAAQQLLDPALQPMMVAVHRVADTVHQVLGAGLLDSGPDHAPGAQCPPAPSEQRDTREQAIDFRFALPQRFCHLATRSIELIPGRSSETL